MAFPGITNHGPIEIPGTTVVAYFGIRASEPTVWIYSLWINDGTPDETAISTGSIDFESMPVTPEQVARVAFLLDVEYAS